MDRDQFFDNIFNETGDAAAAIRLQRQLAYEERVIKRVFTECGIKINSWGRLVNECRNETGVPKLSFRWFNSSTRFPVRLCGRRFPGMHELTIADLFKPAEKNRLFKAIVKNLHKQEIDATKGFVFVFPVVRTMYCAHNVLGAQSVGPRWTMHLENAILTVEPTASFFKCVGSEWFLG
ncbi:hypothetical protein EBZ39_04550 [bacterium]|nr:hypothetical protein [bacterium]